MLGFAGGYELTSGNERPNVRVNMSTKEAPASLLPEIARREAVGGVDDVEDEGESNGKDDDDDDGEDEDGG